MTHKTDWLCVATLLVSIAMVSAGETFFEHATQKATVPARCLHNITITDFHKPCIIDSKNPNMAHCDDVVIKFACVEYVNNDKSKTP